MRSGTAPPSRFSSGTSARSALIRPSDALAEAICTIEYASSLVGASAS